MRNRLSFGLVFAAAAIFGCACNNPPATDTGPILHLDMAMVDGGTAHPDTGGIDAGPVGCGHAGLAGGPCRAGACQATLHCFDPAAFMNASTVQALFGLQQGDLTDPAHPGYQIVQSPQVMADSAPFNGWAGTFCAQECDTTAMPDTCGSCNSCSRSLTQVPLLQAFGGAAVFYGTMAMFPYANEGVCRLQCTYDATTRGAECDMQHTCEAFGGVCVEACTADNECNTAYGVTYSGQTVTLLDHMNPAHCNMTTGRCEYAGTAAAHVGSTCNGTNDCAPTTGVCINGGLCAEFNGCTPGQGCGMGNSGVCLTANNTMHSQAICIQGCTATTDCAAGNVCAPLTQAIGGHMGYCIGQCMSDDQCHANETCTDYTTMDPMTGAAVAHPGQCVHRCGGAGAPIMVGQTGMTPATMGMMTTPAAGDCLTTEFCVADHMGANYGSCRILDVLCGTPNTNSLPSAATDCPMGQLCDETLATPHGAATTTAPRGPIEPENFGDGHCLAPCTATSCTAPAVCVPSTTCTVHMDMASCAADAHCAWDATSSTCGHKLAGLCRQPCTMDAMGTCPQDQHCDTAIGYCVECPTNVPRGMTPPANCM